MYLVYCFALLVFVYISPALAVFPRLILSARVATAIPFVSIFVIWCLQQTLTAVGAFSQTTVLTFSSGSALIASYRIRKLFTDSNARFDWPPTHRFLLVFNALVVVCFSAKLGSTSFRGHDEIYSWNMWAVQHYLGEPIDYYYTQSPYPQLFSILIAYCYKLLGSIELQLPVRALFGIFPFCLLSAIAVAPQEANYNNVARFVILIAILLLGTWISKNFDDGLADPMMASALIVSVSLFIHYVDSKNKELLWVAVICGIVAAYSKQPALIWTLISLPTLILLGVLRGRLPPVAMLAAGAILLFSLAWIVGEGSGFQYNKGVIDRSLQERGLIEQLLFATNTYFVKRPLLFLLLLASLISVINGKKYLDIFLIALVPSLLMWFIFGAYDVRLGIHVVSLGALLLTATKYNLPYLENSKVWERIGRFIQSHQIQTLVFIGVLVVTYSYVIVQKTLKEIGDGFDLYQGGKNTIYRYFGRDSAFVYEEIYQKPYLVLWIPTNYIYGIFYGHNKVARPKYDPVSQYTKQSFISEIMEVKPDYLFYGGKEKGVASPASDVLKELTRDCSYLFRIVAGLPNNLGYEVYQLTKDSSLLNQCRVELDKT